jgi:polysaccharide biosynthesis transport protein
MAVPSSIPSPQTGERNNLESFLSLLEIWRALRKHRVLAISITVGVVLAATFFTLGETKIYRAEATIQIDPKPPQPLGNDVQQVVDMGTGNFWSNKEYYQTQFAIISSNRVAMAVVKQLHLQSDAAFLEDAPPNSKVAPEEVDIAEAADILKKRLTVTPVKDSRLVTVALDDADKARAEKILSALVDTYVEQNLDYAVASTSSAVDWLKGQLDSLQKNLESSEMALHEYKQANNILSVSYDDQNNILRSEIQKLNDGLTDVKAQEAAVASRKSELEKISDDDPSELPAEEMLKDEVLANLRMDYVSAKRDRDALISSGKGTNHPDVLAANARVKTTKQELLDEVANVKGAVDNDLKALSAQAAGLTKLLDAARKQALGLNLMEIQYDRLARTKDDNEKLYALVQERTKESELTQMMRVNNIRVIDRPLLPRKPVRPRVPLNLAVGALAGLFLSVGTAVGREFFDRTIKSPDDIEGDVGLVFLGLLPQMDEAGSAYSAYGTYGRRQRKKARGDKTAVEAGPVELLVHQHPASGVAESARAIRTNLLFMAPDRPFSMLAVTSAAPSEGKTTVACSIAIAMAQTGQRVLILDCDMRRPRLHRIFGKLNDVGVTTALLNTSSLDAVISPTDVPNLHVLPSGPLPPNPADLLHSEAFARVLAAVKERYDRIIIDSPPVVPVTDAAVLSTKVDATVLVVRSSRTTKELARQAARALRDVGANLVGAVLNAVDLSARSAYYDHYSYAYYRREGYAPDPTSARHTTGS